MKNLSKFATVAVIGSVFLAGCSLDPNKYDPEEVRAETKATFAEFQTTASGFSNGQMVTDLEQLFSDVQNAVSEEDWEKFQSGFASTSDKYDALSPEGQKIVADLFRDFSPVSKFYNYDEMTDAQIATVGAMDIMILAATDENDAKAASEINEQYITVDDARHAKIQYDDPEKNETSTSRDVFLIKVDKEWKIDGAKTYEDYVTPEPAPTYSK